MDNSDLSAEEIHELLERWRLEEPDDSPTHSSTAIARLFDVPIRKENVVSPKKSDILLGFSGIDSMLGGLEPGKVYSIVADVSGGVSSLLVNIVRQQVRGISLESGEKRSLKPVLYTPHQNKDVYATRLLCSEAKVERQRLSAPLLNDVEMGSLAVAADRLLSGNIHFADEKDAPLEELRRLLSPLKIRQSLDVLLIDSVEALLQTALFDKTLYVVMERIQKIAKELDIPVVVTSRFQETRNQERHKSPQLGQVNPSVAIASDYLLLLHRPDYWSYGGSGLSEKGLELLSLEVFGRGRSSLGRIPLVFNRRYGRVDTLPWGV